MRQQLAKLASLHRLKAAERDAEAAEARRYLYDPVGWIKRFLLYRDDQGLAPYQEDILRALAERKRAAARGPHGLGKAKCINTPMYTTAGWKTVGTLVPGDQVFDENGRPCNVVAKSEIFLGPTYEVEFADGSMIVTHGQHEWNALDVYTRPKGVKDWRDHWGSTRRVTTERIHDTLRSPGGQLRWRIPTARPLEFPEAELPIDPYLLGVWLGDGHVGSGLITLNRDDSPEMVARIPGGHFVPSGENPGSRAYRIPGFMAQLRDLGVLDGKRIPRTYLTASVEQRRELIRGLWDTDGYRQDAQSDEITFTNEPLADDVAELVRGLGLVVRRSEGVAAYTIDGERTVTGTRYRLAARFDFNPYHLSRYSWTSADRQASRHTQRTIVDVRRIEDRPTQCIEVDSPSHLYLAGESLIPTHNSMLAACVVIWFVCTREAAGIDWKVLTTASAWRHLTKYLWPEIHKWVRGIHWEELGREPFSDRNELLDLTLKLKFGAASAVASSRPEFIEGAHADSLLYVIDEAKIVPDESWDAIEGAFSGGRADGLPEAFALAISTPGPPRGRFYEIHRKAPGLGDWSTRHVKLEEAIAAGRISREWAQQRALQWGEDSALYANRVLGEFHEGDEDTLIPLSWIEAAIERWRAWDDAGRPELTGKHVVGVDVARSGGDSTILAHRIGHCVVWLEAHNREDTMLTTGRVIPLIRREEDDDTEDPKRVAVVDSIGVGGGVVDRLRELKLPVLAYTGSAKTTFRDRTQEYGFANTRSAAYYNLRQLLEPAYGAELMLPPDDLMISDLNTPRWTIVTGVPPKIKVQTKEEVTELLGRSCDRGDAVAMALWAEQLRRDGQLSVPQGRLPVRSLSPLAGLPRVRTQGMGQRSGMGPLG